MTKNGRLLSVGPTPPPVNGMSVATSYFLQSRAMEEYDVVHIDTADRRGLRNIGRFDAANIVGAFESGARFLVALIRHRPHVVYVPIAQNTLGFLRDCLFLVPSLVGRIPIVIHIHGGHFGRFFSGSPGWMRWLVRGVVGRARAVVVLGETLRPMLEGVTRPDRVYVVPNGIDDFAGDSSYSTIHGDGRTVLYLSTLMADKGVLDLLRAAGSACRELPYLRFQFAGEWFSPDEEAEAAQLIGEQGLLGRVEFLGVVSPPEKWRLLQEAECFVLPSNYRFEGQPYSIIEAMCAGLPVISTAVGAIEETVVAGVTGLIVVPGDVKGLSDAIVAVMNSEVDRASMGAAGRQRYLEHFTFERWSDDMVEIFRAVHSTSLRQKGSL